MEIFVGVVGVIGVVFVVIGERQLVLKEPGVGTFDQVAVAGKHGLFPGRPSIVRFLRIAAAGAQAVCGSPAILTQRVQISPLGNLTGIHRRGSKLAFRCRLPLQAV